MEQKLNLKEIFLREGIILAAIPVVAYYSAYQCNAGYFGVFGAPVDLISVDVTTFVVFGSVLLGISIILYNVLSLLWAVIADLPNKKSWKQFVLSSILFFLILWVLFFFLYDDWRTTSLISSVYLLLFIAFYFAILYKALPRWLLIGILRVSLLTGISRAIGHYQARTQKVYTVITSLGNTFVIRKIGDYFLCSTYDVNSHTFSKSLRLLPIKDNGLDLEYKDIGPLHPLK